MFYNITSFSHGTGQVSVCRLDGGNIIFMDSSMANGGFESDSDSDIGKQLM